MIRKIGTGLLVSGIILYVVLAIFGLVRAGIFIIFPFLISTNPLALIPFFMILAGFVLLAIPPFRGYKEGWDSPGNHDEGGKEEKKFGGLILIGPIPIIFGNDRRIVYILAAIAAVIILILVLYYIGRQGYLIHP